MSKKKFLYPLNDLPAPLSAEGYTSDEFQEPIALALMDIEQNEINRLGLFSQEDIFTKVGNSGKDLDDFQKARIKALALSALIKTEYGEYSVGEEGYSKEEVEELKKESKKELTSAYMQVGKIGKTQAAEYVRALDRVINDIVGQMLGRGRQ